jgi:hypothetical protein
VATDDRRCLLARQDNFYFVTIHAIATPDTRHHRRYQDNQTECLPVHLEFDSVCGASGDSQTSRAGCSCLARRALESNHHQSAKTVSSSLERGNYFPAIKMRGVKERKRPSAVEDKKKEAGSNVFKSHHKRSRSVQKLFL